MCLMLEFKGNVYGYKCRFVKKKEMVCRTLRKYQIRSMCDKCLQYFVLNSLEKIYKMFL